METIRSRPIQKIISMLFIVCLNSTSSFAQCTINSTSGYTVQISVTPLAIIPSSANCVNGYNYNVQFSYSITVTGINTSYNGNIGIQPQIFCNNQNNGNYTIHVAAPTVGSAASSNTYNGTLTTQTNPWTTATDCNTATPSSQNCNSMQVTIFGPGISTNTYPCVLNNMVLSTGTIAASLCAGTAVSVPYTKVGTFNTANIFTAQLSNATGSFDSPVNIGNITSANSGSIAATIPAGTVAGTGYRIRVVSSNPIITGSNNGANLTLGSAVASVSITANPATAVCPGSIVTFTATPVNGGSSPSYQWTKNGSDISGATSVSYSGIAGSAYTAGDLIRCKMTSGSTCVTSPVTSAAITMSINAAPVAPTNPVNNSRCGPGTVALSVSAPSGSTINWYAAASGGTALLSGNVSYTTPAISATTTYYAESRNTASGCVSGTRTAITATVYSVLVPSVAITITSGSNPSCSGSAVTFTANAVNGGTFPTYQWTKNGTNIAGATSSTFTGIAGTDFVSTNQIRVKMTSNATCVSPATATSAAITTTVTNSVMPTISITALQANICTGLVFQSSITNGGTSPAYQWKNNGSDINGATASSYTASVLSNGDMISCVLTSNANCALSNPVTSSALTASLTVPVTSWLGTTSNWNLASNWSNGIPASGLSVLIPAGTPNNPVITCLAKCNNLTINSGASLTITGSNIIEVYGSFTNDGTFNPGNSEMKFKSCSGMGVIQHNISTGNGTTTTFCNLTLDDIAGAVLNTDANLKGALTLTNGIFTNNNKVFTLKSTAAATARIAPVTSPEAGYSGDIRMERFAPGGKTGWTQLGSPVSGTTIAQWNDNFDMSGFAGAYQGASVNGFISVYTYDETAPGNFDSNGSYAPATNITDNVPVGKGFWVYLGNGSVYTSGITIDVTGQPTIGNYNFNPVYTNNSNSADGFNLVSNPYPSTIDWLSPGWTKTNIDDAIYMYQADNNQYASYVNGIGTNGGSRYIASSQGFYIQANATGPVLNITEAAKSNANPAMIRDRDPDNLLRLVIRGNDMQDETVIHLNSEATRGFDGKYDAAKFYSPDPLWPSITTVVNGKDISINSLPFYANTISIPINLKVGVPGAYTLSWSGLDHFAEGSCITLEDLDNGNKINLTGMLEYDFTSEKVAGVARFIIYISTPLKRSITPASCNKSKDGAITLQNPFSNLCKVQLSDINDVLLNDTTFSETMHTFDKLASGTYKITYPEAGQCGAMIQTITVEALNNLSASFKLLSTETVIGKGIGFSAPVNKNSIVSWNFGDGSLATEDFTVEHQYFEEGAYNVTLTTRSGECTDQHSILLNVSSPKEAVEPTMQIQRINGSYYAVFNFEQPAKASITIANIMGREVAMARTFEGKEGKILLELPDTENGILLITLSDGLRIITKRIMNE